MDKAIIVDVSHWNKNLNWQEMYKGGVRFAYVKLSQGKYIVDRMAVQHIAEARAAGIIVAGYHWADPTQSDADQLTLLTALMQKYELDLVFIDVEQYWQDWGEWQRKEVTKFIDPMRIDRNARNLYHGAIQNGFKAVIYTNASFIDSYAKPIWNWIYNANVCWAYYPYKAGRVVTDWENIYTTKIPALDTPKRLVAITDKGGIWEPLKKWDIWQFSGDKFILPGTGGSPIDLNIAYDENKLRELFGASPVVVVPEEPPPAQETNIAFTVIRPVNIRASVGTSSAVTGVRKTGDVVNVLDVKVEKVNRVWVRDAQGWSALVHDNVQFMRSA